MSHFLAQNLEKSDLKEIENYRYSLLLSRTYTYQAKMHAHAYTISICLS